VLGVTLPDPGPKYRPGSSSTIHFNHCSTVTVNLELTHPTNCGHIPATLPDDADSSKLESGAVAAMLRSTLFRSVLLAPRSHLEGLNYWQPCPTILTYTQEPHQRHYYPGSRTQLDGSPLFKMHQHPRHGASILLRNSDSTSHSLLSLITLPIPFPDYSQHLPHHQHL